MELVSSVKSVAAVYLANLLDLVDLVDSVRYSLKTLSSCDCVDRLPASA